MIVKLNPAEVKVLIKLAQEKLKTLSAADPMAIILQSAIARLKVNLE